MQSFLYSMYLYIVKNMRHQLLLALLAWTTMVYADGDYYAVIVSGGRSKLFNHERYWNDCAFLYRTLRQKYIIPKDHITLLMADGDNSSTDMLCDGTAGFASSPTDLDNDGMADLTLAATRQNLNNSFRQLSTMLTASDHLFLFITDHGERSSDGNVCLWMWGDEQLTPDELAAMVNQCHPATMNILLGQCHAGAFIAPLLGEGRIITAACTADQMSWSSPARPYDEFVYHWTCAIAGHDEYNQPIDADYDGDGIINMQEAYDYACLHDCRPETPCIIGMPENFASGWSFSCRRINNDIIFPNSTSSKTIYNLHGQKRICKP